MQEEWVDAAASDEIANNECKVIDLDDDPVVIYHVDGEFFALDDLCTHDGGDLSSGWAEDGCAVCPRHGAKFDLRTGEVMAPPAYEDIHPYPIRIREGRVEVRDDRDD